MLGYRGWLVPARVAWPTLFLLWFLLKANFHYKTKAMAENIHENLSEVLFDEVLRITEPLGITVVECAVKRGKNGITLIVVIDTPGGVRITDCEKVSRMFASRIDVLGLGGLENYNLQVTSPGIGRELKSRREYDIFKGKKVKVTLRHPLDKTKAERDIVVRGELLGIEGETVSIAGEQEVITIPFSSIKRTKLDG
jgi:ribosome maturation factor RimP